MSTTIANPTLSRNGHKVIPQDRSNDSESVVAIMRPGRRFPEHTSFSSLNNYASCPASWALSRLDRRNSSPVLARQRSVGEGTHQVLDLMSKGSTAGAAVQHIAAHDPLLGSFGPEIEQMVQRCVEWAPADPNRASLRGTEVEMKAKVSGYNLVAVVDAFEVDDDGVLVVSDYKTGRPPHPVAEVAGADSKQAIYQASATRQVVLYAEIAEAAGTHVGRGRMIFPATQTVIEVNLDDERGRILRTEARQFVEYQGDRLDRSFRTGEFKTRPTQSKCAGCSVAAFCPAGQELSGRRVAPC